MTYKFRAECSPDVVLFYDKNQRDIKKIVINRPHKNFPDVEVTIDTSLSLDEIKMKLQKQADGHVMAETVAKLADYTGERKP